MNKIPRSCQKNAIVDLCNDTTFFSVLFSKGADQGTSKDSKARTESQGEVSTITELFL